MLTAKDICKQIGIDMEQVAYLHAIKFLPEPIRINGQCRWRENDIKKLKRYLLARSKCRSRGIDPDSPSGPSIPVYSTAGNPRFDPRLAVANEKEAERQKRSRTLAAGSAPIAQQPQVTLPESSGTKAKAEG